MVAIKQVTGDAPTASAMKVRNQKSPLGDIVKSLLSHLMRRVETDGLTAEQRAELLELYRRIHGNA